jgi:TusA-related sulfurtransferase/uncharacterized OsmC-like protein
VAASDAATPPRDPPPALPAPDAVCEGGDMDCGSGLLLVIRDALRAVPSGGVLEVRSREGSVREDLPAWCRMTGHAFLGDRPAGASGTAYLLRRAAAGAAADAALDADLAKARNFTWTVRVRGEGPAGARAFARNHALPLGSPADLDTAAPAPSAVETLLASLGGCLAVGFRWRASRRGIEVRGLELSLKARSDNLLVFLGVEDEGSPGLASVEGSLWVDADAPGEVLRALWDETVRRSPVAQTLLRGTKVTVDLRIA